MAIKRQHTSSWQRPPPATIASACFPASGNFVQQAAPDVLSVFCDELHPPLLWWAGTEASMQNQHTDQPSRVCWWLSAGFPGGGGEAEDADNTSHPRHQTMDRLRSRFSKTDWSRTRLLTLVTSSGDWTCSWLRITALVKNYILQY